MNSVQYIQKHQPLSKEQRAKIKKLGRPLPDLEIQTKRVGKSREFNRYFKRETSYDKFPWMCGCPATNKLYCFVCLVTDEAKASQWTNEGVWDLQHLQDRAVKHSLSPSHLNHLLDFKLLGADSPKDQLDVAYLRAISDHNEKVDKNRQTLRRLITCLRFSGAFELPLNKFDSHGQGIFHGLLDFVSGSDYSWEGLSRSSILQKGSESIRHELLDAILRVCKEEVAAQAKRANFVALEVEKVEDCRLVIIFRYFLEEKIVQRFWDVVQLQEYTAHSISNVVLRELDALGVVKEKLIAQSSNIPIAIFGSVREAIKDRYPNANFVHHYPFHFKTVLENAAFGTKKMNVFFAFLRVFQAFFSQSSQRVDVLEEVLHTRLAWSGSMPFNYKTDVVKELHGRTEVFRECLKRIVDDTRDGETISVAGGLLTVLESEDFEYFLEVVHSIIPHLESFFKRVHLEGAGGTLVDKNLEELESKLSHDLIQEAVDRIGLGVKEKDGVGTASKLESFKRIHSEAASGTLEELEAKEQEGVATASKRQRVEPDSESGPSQDEADTKVSLEEHQSTEESSAGASKRRRVEPEECCVIKIEVKDEEITESELLGQLIEAEYMSIENYDAREMKVEVVDGEVSGIDVLTWTSAPEEDPLSQNEPSGVKLEIDDEINDLASTSKLVLEPEQLQELKAITKEYRSALIKELKERYTFTGYLSAEALLHAETFPTNKVSFPEATFDEVVEAYHFIDKAKLRIELGVLYGRTDLTSGSLLLLLTFICRNDLQEGLSETYKLLEVLCTTLMSTEEAERCYSALKTVENLAKKCGNEQRLGALAMLSIEKSMVQAILDFDNKVINVFAENQDRVDFKYM